MIKESRQPEGTVVFTDHQLVGKGQRGNSWEDEPGKNILMSMLLEPRKLPIKDQFYLNLISGLAVMDVLSDKLRDKEIKLKWPNDVMVNGCKISGILIESTIRGHFMDTCVVGIGFNTNQQTFKVEGATSLSLESGLHWERELLMEDLLVKYEARYRKLLAGGKEQILADYYDCLYWMGEIRSFKDTHGVFSGMIKGVSDNGLLVIQTSSEEKRFDVKEVQFMN